MVVLTMYSNNAFAERVAKPSWHSIKAEDVVPEDQKFIVMNDAKSVTAESLGSYSDI
jgi:hypothetical protein